MFRLPFHNFGSDPRGVFVLIACVSENVTVSVESKQRCRTRLLWTLVSDSLSHLPTTHVGSHQIGVIAFPIQGHSA